MIGRKPGLSVLILLMLAGIQCATRSATEPPRDILGIGIGMTRADVQKRLEEIAFFERSERKNQQVWRLKDDPHYSHLAVGYDANNQIRYITAFADKAKTQIPFSDIGNLSKAKKEIIEQHHTYVWEVPATGASPAYFVNVYGDNPKFLTTCSLSKKSTPNKSEAEEEEEED